MTPDATLPSLAVQWLGMLPYDDAARLQQETAAGVASGSRPPTLLLLEHPPVYTLGRGASEEHLLWDEDQRAERGVSVRRVDRGGDITFHGPGQLVGYPILPLAAPGWSGLRLPAADFTGYLRRLESVLILALQKLGVSAFARPGLTGVWVTLPPDPPGSSPQPAKIASIGVKVDVNGVSSHGFALNISPDMAFWDGIIPCGLQGVRMTSLAELLPACPPVEEAAHLVSAVFCEVFAYRSLCHDERSGVISPAARGRTG